MGNVSCRSPFAPRCGAFARSSSIADLQVGQAAKELVVAAGAEIIRQNCGPCPGFPHEVTQSRLIAVTPEAAKIPPLLHQLSDTGVSMIPPKERGLNKPALLGHRLVVKISVLMRRGAGE